jgi:hypothetical protein
MGKQEGKEQGWKEQGREVVKGVQAKRTSMAGWMREELERLWGAEVVEVEKGVSGFRGVCRRAEGGCA